MDVDVFSFCNFCVAATWKLYLFKYCAVWRSFD